MMKEAGIQITQQDRALTGELLDFIEASPTAFHAVDTILRELQAQGCTVLTEGQAWDLKAGGTYAVTRNGSSVIAFRLGEDLAPVTSDDPGHPVHPGERKGFALPAFHIMASHSDSPMFRIKEQAELSAVADHYRKLNTEGYGGMICSTWLDRPLSIAGRVIVRNGQQLQARLLKVDRDLVLIPNLAIHFNRKVNDGFAFNKQIDLLPLLGGADTPGGSLKKLIASELEVEEESILGSDLYLYNRVKGSIWGAAGEFVSSGRLDDLQCTFAGLKAFLAAASAPGTNVSVLAVFDNEEVGSHTKQGAASTFLPDILERICISLGMDREDYRRAIASSLMISADNAHAVHPNHPEKSDENNRVYMNEGVVVKSHAGQKYTSDGLSMAWLRALAEQSHVPLQYFANRSDEAGGSTLGNIAMSQVSVSAVDVGLAQLAMHSAYETAGVKDTKYLADVAAEFYRSQIRI